MDPGTLRLDTNELVSLGRDLRGVADEFHNANNNSDAAAEAAGGGDLGETATAVGVRRHRFRRPLGAGRRLTARDGTIGRVEACAPTHR